MRVFQILTTFEYGDGVGNDCLAIKHVLKNNGYETEIFAENIGTRVADEAKYIGDMPETNDDDIIIYHFAIGCDLNLKVLEMKGKLIIRYHNVTPPEYYKNYDSFAYSCCKKGYEDLEIVAKKSKYALSDSNYNNSEMIKAGFRGLAEVMPIMIPWDDYKKVPNYESINKFHKKGANLLFLGRVVPNKRQERLLEIFYYYKKYYDSDAKLFLVGSFLGPYYEELQKYAELLELSDVYFSGKVKFDEILAYYDSADVFVCMSDHEGFCIPLLEAMKFQTPVVALNTSAVGETLGYGGVCVKEYNPLEIAALISRVNTNEDLRKKIISNQNERLKDFDTEKTERKLLGFLKKIEMAC